MKPYFESLKEEIKQRSVSFSNIIDTVYLGGGTPSLLSVEMLSELYSCLLKHFNFNDNIEWTIEVNPDDVTADFLQSLLTTGFNRISIGVQSFKDEDLRQMGRRHNAAQAVSAVELARKSGFHNISIDLIYGLPWSNEINFGDNLKIMQKLNVQHLSAYHLTFEAGTPFTALLKKGFYKEISDESSLMQYQMLRKAALEVGFEHYEVSNFCMPGFQSRHNSAYWKGEPYIGLGPGSHSFFNNIRSWNKGNLELYNAKNYEAIHEQEYLTDIDRFNERIMLGLRTSDGVNLQQLKIDFPKFFENLFQQVQPRIQQKHLVIEDEFLRCTAEGWFLSDAIIEELFLLN
jgi:oxygen-independent coproporphyrinogen-3 oxidase